MNNFTFVILKKVEYYACAKEMMPPTLHRPEVRRQMMSVKRSATAS